MSLTNPNARLDTLLGLSERADQRVAQASAERAEYVELARKESVALSGGKDPVMQARVFQSEVAAALHISEHAAGFLISSSYSLVERLPKTLAALKVGAISYSHAQAMVGEATTLSDEEATELEATVFDLLVAKELAPTPPQLRKIARKVREFRHPESIPARHEAARELRGIRVEPGEDGMSDLVITGPTTQVNASFDKLTKAALACHKDGDKRSLNNKRADIFFRVMLASSLPGENRPDGVPVEDDSEEFVRWYRGIVPTVMITVPVLSLLGQSIQPGTLDGVTPVDIETAKRLTARAPSAIRLLTNPETGVVLSVGRKRYKIPKDLRLWLMIRDQTCRYPGCGKPARNSQIDHTHEWHELGETEHTNLAHLCQFHHTMKSLGLMESEQAADGSGVLTWTFPSGRKYVTHPAVEMGGYAPSCTAAQADRIDDDDFDDPDDFDLLPEDPMTAEEFAIVVSQTVERARLWGENA